MTCKRPPTVDDAVRYDTASQAYIRKIDNKQLINPISNKNKQNEFLWIIEKLTGTPFNETEWNGIETISDISMCICSQEISHVYLIKHIPSNKQFLVGSQCVKKISTKLAGIITHDKCKKCSEPVMDKRTKYGKLGFCSRECMYLVPFGKHKGKTIDELPRSYISWMNKTLQEMELKNDSKDSWMIKTMRYIVDVAD